MSNVQPGNNFTLLEKFPYVSALDDDKFDEASSKFSMPWNARTPENIQILHLFIMPPKSIQESVILAHQYIVVICRNELVALSSLWN